MAKTSRILMSTKGPEDWQQLLARPEKHWRPGYSAWALAHCWEAAAGLPTEIERLFGSSDVADLHGVKPLIAIPEYAVDLPGGDQPSMNDVFVLGSTPAGAVTIMIEGKVNESFGPVVKDWGRDSSPGKKERWSYLTGLLGVDANSCGELRYQLFHRTASALIEARRLKARDAVMIVHSFSAADAGSGDYKALAELFGVEAGIGEMVFVREQDGIRLHIGWARGDSRFLD
jgi:hypothetical protein